MIIKIPLTQGKFTLVDDEDYEKIRNIKFCVHQSRNTCYAVFRISKGKMCYLHRLIMKLKKNEMCDHINGDGLDNRRLNLRIVNNSQNQMNSIKRIIKSSQYIGVSWHNESKKWQSKIQFNHCLHYLGVFTDEMDAAKAYYEAARKLGGEYARLNFSENLELEAKE